MHIKKRTMAEKTEMNTDFMIWLHKRFESFDEDMAKHLEILKENQVSLFNSLKHIVKEQSIIASDQRDLENEIAKLRENQNGK